MNEQVLALIYLDARIFVNRVRVLARDPKRLLPWLIFLAWMGWALPARFFFARGRVRNAGFEWGDLLPMLVPGIALAIVGAVVWMRSSRAPAGFSSPADARFLCGSALSPRLVVFWLQVRQARRQLLVWGANVVLWVFILPFALRITVLEALRAAVVLAVAGTFLTGIQLPVFVAARRGAASVLRVTGITLVVVGVAAVASGTLSLAAVSPLPSAILTAIPPGSWVVGAVEGQVAPFAALVVLAVVAVAASVAVGGDCYPELWQSSIRVIAARRALRQRGWLRQPSRRRASAVASVGPRWVPPGAWALLWKEWIALGRGAIGSRMVALILVFSFVAGAGLVLLASESRRGAGVAGGIGGLVVVTAFAIAMGNTVRLASDLRSPLWWLSASGITARMAAWTLAGALKAAVPFAVASVGAALAGRSLLWLGFAPVALAICWMLRSTALAAYSLLPSSLDIAGPGRLLRALIFYVLLAPIVVASVLAMFLTRQVAIAAAATCVIASVEGAVLVLATAWRISGNGLAFALAERR